jgi:ABC-type polysaccharide/polyol phosphate transport system ATPase subunit
MADYAPTVPMPPDDVAVSVDGVSKEFRLPREQVHTLKERMVHPFRRRSFDRLHALRDVSLQVGKGEFFGIVGRNGSGKSTLMKCLAGIYRADAGEMWLRGRMAPFIELGVGFNPDLTAHDNVLINAVMLGLTPDQARERYDAIIDFAELREFEDLKLKNYSSGMQVRLAFAVMVHVDADLLLIDEVLAVGDAAFQQKCYDVLTEARRAGHTILLVTHDMDQVQRFCDRAMLLERGEVVEIGPSRDVARRYLELNFTRPSQAAEDEGAAPVSRGGAALIVDAWSQNGVGLRTDVLEQGGSCAMCLRVRFLDDTADPVFAVTLRDANGRAVFAASTEWDDRGLEFGPGEVVDVALTFDNWFAPGRYTLEGEVRHPGSGRQVMASSEQAAGFVVTGSRAGGGVVDVPHAFALFQRGEVLEDRGAIPEASA